MLGLPLIVANDIENMRIEEAARKALRAWRYQQIRIRGRKAVARILTSILAFSIGSLAP
jgi:hypothetical protein